MDIKDKNKKTLFVNAKKSESNFAPIITFWVIVILLSWFLFAFFTANNQTSQNTNIAPTTLVTKTTPALPITEQPITNPDYLANPSSFVVDRQNVVSAIPLANAPVWVENLWDENSLLVSYPVIANGKKVLKVQQLNLVELYDYNYLTITGTTQNPVVDILKRQNKYADDMMPFISCIRQATVSYMENTVKHNYIEIIHPADDLGTVILGYVVTMNGQDLGQKIVSDGFGIGSVSYGPNTETDYYSQEEQVAILTNAGMWGTCLPKL